MWTATVFFDAFINVFIQKKKTELVEKQRNSCAVTMQETMIIKGKEKSKLSCSFFSNNTHPFEILREKCRHHFHFPEFR